jgi:hypothetical protein
VPTPGTFFVLTVTAEDDVAPAAPAEALLAAELGLALEPDPEADVPAEAPQAATAMAAPKITPPPSSLRAVEPEWTRTVVLTRETPSDVAQNFKLFPLVTGLGPGEIAVHRRRFRRTAGAPFVVPAIGRACGWSCRGR